MGLILATIGAALQGDESHFIVISITFWENTKKELTEGKTQ